MINDLPTIPYSELSLDAITHLVFDGHDITVATAPRGSRIDVTDFLRDQADFHGPKDVDHIINFGSALSSLIGTYKESSIPGQENVEILARTSKDALRLITEIDTLARQLIKNPLLYDDVELCNRYYDLAAEGYKLLSDGRTDDNSEVIPVSLIRAGLVTTRLARGLDKNDTVPNEVQVETKRAHPIDGKHEDIIVTVRWSDFEDPLKMQGRNIEIADFVNPASWASTAAFLLALRVGHGVVPKSVMHRSFVGTSQGIALASRVCRDMNIKTSFKLVGITDTMNEDYYLSGDIAVGDAGQALRHFRPKKNQ